MNTAAAVLVYMIITFNGAVVNALPPSGEGGTMQRCVDLAKVFNQVFPKNKFYCLETSAPPKFGDKYPPT